LYIIINALNEAEGTLAEESVFPDTTLKHFSCFRLLVSKCFAKNKPVESTDYETGLPDATLTEA
jgi:hypothetical protein